MKSNKKEGICIDTNIILGLGRTIAHKYKKAQHAKLNKIISDELNKNKGILYNLSQMYELTTPISSKYEFINKLRAKEGIFPDESKRIFEEIRSKFGILLLTFKEEKNFLTYAFFEDLIKCDLGLADGIQLFIASKKRLPFVTGDKRDLQEMRKFYSEVFTYPEIRKKY